MDTDSTDRIRAIAERYFNDDAREDLDPEKWGLAITPADVLYLLDEIDRLRMAFSDLADDICGLQPVCTPDNAIRAISQHDLKLRQRIETLRALLVEACDMAEEGWAYADGYFRDKWNCAGRLSQIRALAEGEGNHG